jgi:NitT/TauT family transport system ATP-binding protein
VTADVPDAFVPYERAANFPWTSHALWFYSQMVRWGEVSHSPARAEAAALTFRPDIYRAALAPLRVAVPLADSRAEGMLQAPTAVPATQGSVTVGPDGFFDGKAFDPAQIDTYIASQAKT